MNGMILSPIHTAELDQRSENIVVAAHFEAQYMLRWRELVQEHTVFITLRHPVRCLASHEARNTINSTRDNFLVQWRCMMELMPYCKNILFFHLDALDIREKEAEQMLSYTGTTHEIDWGISPETGSKHGTHDFAITDEYIKLVPSEFIDFYEDTKLLSMEEVA